MNISSKEAFDHLVQLVRLDVKRNGLHAFARHFWAASGEARAFKDSRHLHALARVLEAHARFEMRDTVINVPPSTGKTLWVQVFWPAFVWATVDPTRRFIVTSYDNGKLHQVARQFLRLILHPLFQACYPHIKLRRSVTAEAEIETIAGGTRLAYQMGGPVTSKHGDHVVLDDSNKAGDSEADFAKAVELWQYTFSTRRADPNRHSNLIIGQRLNHDDVCGVMLRAPHNYEHVCFPMRYVPNCPWDYGCSLGKLDVRTEPGELLWPERYSEETVEAIEIAMGNAQHAGAQLQQNPVPATGSYFEDAWFKEWSLPLPHPGAMYIVQSWDLGFKGRAGKGSADSWVSGELWAKHEKRYLLLDEQRGHWNYPETKRQFIAAQSNPLWRAAGCILLEDKANGPALISEIRESVDLQTPIKAVEPHGSKEERAKRHSAKGEAGLLWLPPVEHMPSVAEFRAEIVRFPHQKANDRVDTMTQALDELDDGMVGSLELWKKIIANM
jgi:predicted phage terminase large subunit-like protein